MILLLTTVLVLGGASACGSGATVVLSDPPPTVGPVEAVYEAWGPPGGPFLGTGGPVTVENQTSAAVEYEISSDQGWVLWDVPGTGTIEAGESLTASLSIDEATAPPEVGAHAATVTVREPATDTLRATVDVSLVIQQQWQGTGPVGGPFAGTPDPVVVVNDSGAAYDYELTGSAAWVTWDVAGTGTLEAGAELSLGLGVDAAAAPIQPGTYAAEVMVTDTATGRLRASIAVSLAVTAVPVDGAPMTTAHRTSGVAPLGVFFDAANTTTPFAWTSGVVQPSNARYGRYHYTWDFGDPNAGTWSTDGKSRNADTGFTAAHVYANPGTYTARLTVEDPATGNSYNYQQTITVGAFSGTDYYVDAVNGSDSNNGRTESTAWQTADKAFADGIGTDVRIRFRRGQTFSASQSVTVTAAGPGILGAYGTGAKPVLQFPSTAGLLFAASDWRVADLDLLGPGASGSAAVECMADRQTVSVLLWNLDFRSWAGTPVAWSFWGTVFQNPHTGHIVAECDFSGNNGAMYIGGRQQALLGNRMENNTPVSHMVRIWQMHKGVLAHNIVLDPHPTRHALKLHGPIEGSGQLGRTMFVAITDNVFRGGDWCVTIGPQNNEEDERLSHILYERNRTLAMANRTQIDLLMWVQHATVRNNVFDATGSTAWYSAVRVARRGIEPAPQYVDVYNNTIYKGDAGSEFTLVEVYSECSDVNVRNNLGAAALVSSANRRVVSGTCTNLVTSHNSVTDAPGFEDASNADFRLTATSAAVDAGVSLPEVLEDYAGQARDTSPDLGAFER